MRLSAALVCAASAALLLAGCGKSRGPEEAIRAYVREVMIQQGQSVEESDWSGPKPVAVGKGVGWKLTERMGNRGAARDETLTRVAEVLPDGLRFSQEARGHDGKIRSAYTREVKAGKGYQLFLVGLRVSGGERGHSQTAFRLANLDSVADCGGAISASHLERREGAVVKHDEWEGPARPRASKGKPGVTEVMFVLTPGGKVVAHMPGTFWEWYEKATAE